MSTEYEICEIGSEHFLLLKAPWASCFADVMRANRLTHLRLSGYAGWRGTTVDFLKRLPFLERLDLWATGIRDISPLYELGGLRALSLNGVSRKIDFTQVGVLEDLHLSQWRSGIFASALHCTRLKSLAICGYPGPDLTPLKMLQNLENLAMSFTKLTSVVGAVGLPALTRLSLGRANRLESLHGIEGCKRLALIWIEGAARLNRLDAIATLSHLRQLNLIDCPSIQSLRPIRGLTELEAVSLMHRTKIADGDMSVLKTLPNLRYAQFRDFKHYTHKSEEFPKKVPAFR